jgi:hypothetical protein
MAEFESEHDDATVDRRYVEEGFDGPVEGIEPSPVSAATPMGAIPDTVGGGDWIVDTGGRPTVPLSVPTAGRGDRPAPTTRDAPPSPTPSPSPVSGVDPSQGNDTGGPSPDRSTDSGPSGPHGGDRE